MTTHELVVGLIIRQCVVAIALVASGCKVRIEVPEGGHVESESGAFSCESGQTCDIEIVDFFFEETFQAIADEGHFFRKWEAGDHKVCGGRIAQSCRISTIGQENNLIIQQFLDSDEVFHLTPIFTPGSCTPKRELEDHSQSVGPESYYEYIFQECSLPGVSELVFHGQYRTYRSAESQAEPGNSRNIRCAINYDLGNPNTWAVYDGHGVETVPLIRQKLRLDGSWSITRYDYIGFMGGAGLEITEETRSSPYVFDDCFPWRLAE